METGIIYRYVLNAPGKPEDGWCYIGQTMDEAHRQANWRCATASYGGIKLKNARTLYGVDCWTYSVIKTITADTTDELKKLLNKEEARTIKEYNSDVNGFNTRVVEKVVVRYSDGSEEEFDTVLEAAIANGLFPGSVYYSNKHGTTTRKEGCQFSIN